MIKYLTTKFTVLLFVFIVCFGINVDNVSAQTPVSGVSPTPTTTSCGTIGASCCVTAKVFYTCQKPLQLHFFKKGGGFVGNVFLIGHDCQCYPKNSFSGSLLTAQPSFYCGKGVVDPNDRLKCVDCVNSNGISTALGCIPFDFSGVMLALFRVAIAIASAVSLLCIIFSALKLQVGKSGESGAIEGARSSITSCLVGLVFLLLSVTVLNVLSGGVFGFRISAPLPADPNVAPTQTPTPYPTTIHSPPPPTGAGTPGAPPPRGNPTTSKITSAQVDDALKFFHALRSACPDGVNMGNVDNCLNQVQTGVPHEEDAKKDMKDQMIAINEYDLMCGTFTKVVYRIFTGEMYDVAYTPGANPPGKTYVKNLAEPFWKFKYYPKNQTLPAIGDLVKWKNEPAGHVAIIVSVVNDSRFSVIEANIAGAGKLGLREVASTEEGFAGYYRLEE